MLSVIVIFLKQTIGAAVEPLVDFAAKAYVKEKKLEADNKAYSLLSDMYIDQKDSSGKVIQKMLIDMKNPLIKYIGIMKKV